MRRPDFVVLGQGKAGTTLIYRALQAQPDVGVSTPKELHFFNRNFDRGLGWYTKHFANVPEDVACIGEVSPAYLKVDCIDRLADTLGTDTKLIYILRKPIEQNYARYLQNICARRDAPGFHIRVRPMKARLARIEAALTRAYEQFGPENILPLVFERDIAGPEPKYLSKIRAFLGLAETKAVELTAKIINGSVMPRYLYGGPEGYRTLGSDGAAYWVPAGRLIFCAQDRNSQVWHDVSAEEAAEALAAQSQWSTEVPQTQYAQLQEQVVAPAAQRLMDRFGLDLRHWIDDAPRRIAYPLAPPPAKFRSKDQGEHLGVSQ